MECQKQHRNRMFFLYVTLFLSFMILGLLAYGSYAQTTDFSNSMLYNIVSGFYKHQFEMLGYILYSLFLVAVFGAVISHVKKRFHKTLVIILFSVFFTMCVFLYNNWLRYLDYNYSVFVLYCQWPPVSYSSLLHHDLIYTIGLGIFRYILCAIGFLVFELLVLLNNTEWATRLKKAFILKYRTIRADYLCCELENICAKEKNLPFISLQVNKDSLKYLSAISEVSMPNDKEKLLSIFTDLDSDWLSDKGIFTLYQFCGMTKAVLESLPNHNQYKKMDIRMHLFMEADREQFERISDEISKMGEEDAVITFQLSFDEQLSNGQICLWIIAR